MVSVESPQAKPPRGFTVGAGVLLFGLAVEIFGLAIGYNYYGLDTGWSPNPVVCFLGVAVAFIGLLMHLGRV